MEEFEMLKQQLLNLEKALLEPDIRTSSHALSNILAEDFFEIGSSGRMLYKDVSIQEEGLNVVRMQLSDFDIHPLSNEIFLTTYRIYNEALKEYSLRSSIWMNSEGKWKMKFHQGTKTN